MAQNSVIKFYRGLTDATLPSKKDGAIFIVQSQKNNEDSSDYYGDMYVDIDDATRLHIKPEDAIYTMTNQKRVTCGDPAVPGRVYYIPDFEEITYTVNNEVKTGYKPGVIVGDSSGAYVRDLPVFPVVTVEDKEYWNNKVTAYAVKFNFENNQASDGNDYNLHLSIEDINPLKSSKEI